MADMTKLLKQAKDEAEGDVQVMKMRMRSETLDARDAHLAWTDSRICQVSNVTYAESQEIKAAYKQAFMEASK
jgi:hypothetical protein